MPEFLRFAREAIETAREAGKKKKEHSLRLAELKREGELERVERTEEGLTRRVDMPKPWFDRRAEELSQRAEAEAKIEETGLKEVAATRRTEMEWGPEGARMKEAEASKTAAGRLADVGKAKEKAETTKLNLEEYDRNASSLLYKLGMITYLDGEKQINPEADRYLKMQEALAAENPEEAMRALEFGLQTINAKKAEALENDKLTDEELAAKRAQIEKEKQIDERLKQEALLKEQFPSLDIATLKPQKVLPKVGERLTQRKMIGGARTGILEDIRKPGKWFKSYADLREAARQRI